MARCGHAALCPGECAVATVPWSWHKLQLWDLRAWPAFRPRPAAKKRTLALVLARLLAAAHVTDCSEK